MFASNSNFLRRFLNPLLCVCVFFCFRLFPSFYFPSFYFVYLLDVVMLLLRLMYYCLYCNYVSVYICKGIAARGSC